MKKFYLYVLNKCFCLPQPIRFILIGGWNTFFAYILYMLILFILKSQYPQTALLISFIISTIQSYLMQKIFVFRTKGNYFNEYIKCLGTWSIGYLFNIPLLSVFLYFKFSPYTGQFYSTIIITVYNYVMLKYVAFKNRYCL